MTRTSPTAVKWLNLGARPRPGLAVAPARGGMTLIELVMVVSLLVLLAAIAIPSVQMAVEGRRVREAARAVNVYFGSARNRAMATGRPVGVVLRRFENEGNVCFALDQVETPPPYAGSAISSRAQIRYSGAWQAQFVTSDATPVADPLPPGVVHVGDRVRFNHQGHWYVITGPDAGDGTVTGNMVQLLPPAPVLPWPDDGSWSATMPYEIQRQPGIPGATGLHAAIAKPLQLPLDAVIDLTFSGLPGTGLNVATEGHFSLANAGTVAPVVIMFSPNGGLDCVYAGGPPVPVTQPVFLLIGKRERIPAGTAEDGFNNWQDLENLWISINPQSGLVNTVEMAPGNNLIESRAFARQPGSMGGR